MNDLDIQILREAVDVLDGIDVDYIEEAREALALVIALLER